MTHPTPAMEAAARAFCASFDMDPDELESASEKTDQLVPRWKLDVVHVRAAVLAFLENAKWADGTEPDLIQRVAKAALFSLKRQAGE